MEKNFPIVFVKSFYFLELDNLVKELRRIIIKIVFENGGHFSSNLGTVELILALHYVFVLPDDKIIWDVVDQSYFYKIITGWKIRFNTLRKLNEILWFIKKKESVYDPVTTGHSSTWPSFKKVDNS